MFPAWFFIISVWYRGWAIWPPSLLILCNLALPPHHGQDDDHNSWLIIVKMITIINYYHHHCSHGVFIPLCCYSPSTCTCTSFVQCQWLPLTLTTPKYFCVVVTLPRIFHILQECISCNKNFSWYWTVFPLTSKSPTLLLCCSFHIQLLLQTEWQECQEEGEF